MLTVQYRRLNPIHTRTRGCLRVRVWIGAVSKRPARHVNKREAPIDSPCNIQQPAGDIIGTQMRSVAGSSVIVLAPRGFEAAADLVAIRALCRDDGDVGTVAVGSEHQRSGSIERSRIDVAVDW